jgi:hypothetical protein
MFYHALIVAVVLVGAFAGITIASSVTARLGRRRPGI